MSRRLVFGAGGVAGMGGADGAGVRPAGAARGRRADWRWRLVWAAAGLAALWLGAEAALRWVPFPEENLERWEAGRVVADRHGRPMRVWINREGQDWRPVYVARKEDWVVQALVAAEDQRFWRHGGLDWIALGRAVLQNVANGRRISGASTLSTQVIRLSEPRERVLRTKFIEAFRALQMERRHDKPFILGQWLNRAPFGGNIVGIEAAARRYFGKSAAELDLAEASLLAGVPQSPTRLRPDRHFDRAKRRQAYVLGRMRALGMIDASAETRAFEQRLDVLPAVYPRAAPHFCDWIGATGQPGPGGTLRSTLDPAVQNAAEHALRARLGETDAEGLTGAVVVLENATGAVRAMVGSPDFDALPAGQFNGALAARSAGSTLKPFVYALAFDRGRLTAGSVVADEALHFRDLDPGNFDGSFSGRVTVREALVESLNLPAVGVARMVGLPRVLVTLRNLGLGTLRHGSGRYGVGLALGNGEVRLLDLANAYAALARGGVWKAVTGLEDDAGGGGADAGRRVFGEEACWMVSDALSGEERSMDFAGHVGDAAGLPRVAWKTGTSSGFRDAWTVAWNPEWTVGVWVGRADGRGNPALVGRTMAVPVAAGVFRALCPDGHEKWYERPKNIERRLVCAQSGFLATPGCPETRFEDAIARRTRRVLCPFHRTGAGGDGDASAPGAATVPAPAVRPPELSIFHPADGAVYVYLPDAPALDQRLPLEARCSPPETLYWFVDGRYLGSARAGHAAHWPLTPGAHRIACATASGRSAAVSVTVE